MSITVKATVGKTLQEVSYEPFHVELEAEKEIDDSKDYMDELEKLEWEIELLIGEVIDKRLEAIDDQEE